MLSKSHLKIVIKSNIYKKTQGYFTTGDIPNILLSLLEGLLLHDKIIWEGIIYSPIYPGGPHQWWRIHLQCTRCRFDPTPVFLLENPMGRGAWGATVHRVTKKLNTNEHAHARAGMRTHTHTHTHACIHTHILWLSTYSSPLNFINT